MEILDLSNELSPRRKEELLSMPIQNTLLNPGISMDDVFKYAQQLKYGELHFKMDAKTGLFAIIAIHNTKLGPAIGGCRCIDYPSIQAGIIDAIRLAHMMSYKAAICGLAHGGAKSVIVKPAVIPDRRAFFESFGRFVDEFQGLYIAAMDSGTDVRDMDYIANVTPYVTCTSQVGSGDPAPFTALGVRRGIEAAVRFKFGKSDLNGITIAIQGAGHVGYHLARELTELGAKLIMADIDPAHLQKCQSEFGVSIVDPDEIYSVKCDVFSPCALGAVINANTIPVLNCAIVAGSANNQLKELEADDQRLFERGILYAPDFLINAGGLIQAAASYDHQSQEQAVAQIHNLYNETMAIFERAKNENQSTNRIAQIIADERLS